MASSPMLNAAQPSRVSSFWDLARCKDSDRPEVWVVDEPTEEMEKYATKFCGGCPIQNECREYGIQSRQTTGCWGGYFPGKLKAERRRRTRAKAEQAS